MGRVKPIDLLAESVREAVVAGNGMVALRRVEPLIALLRLNPGLVYRVARWRRTQQARLWTPNGALSMTWGPGSVGQPVAFVSFVFPLGNGQGLDLANTTGPTLSKAWRDMLPHLRRVQVLA